MSVESQVRTVTGYDSTIISASDYTTLEEMAKEDIADEVGEDQSDIDFSSGSAKAALRWLTCIFCKMHVGEIGSEGYSIGEVETKDLNDQAKVWFRKYQTKRDSMRGTSLMGHVRGSRDNRAYGEAGDTAYGGSE